MIKTASDLGEKLCDTLEQAGALGRTAGQKLDDVLTDSARAVRGAGEAIGGMAERTATRLDSTATYVRNYDPGRTAVGFRRAVRRNPAGFVTAAIAAGFVFGFVVRRKWSNSTAPPAPRLSQQG